MINLINNFKTCCLAFIKTTNARPVAAAYLQLGGALI